MNINALKKKLQDLLNGGEQAVGNAVHTVAHNIANPQPIQNPHAIGINPNSRPIDWGQAAHSFNNSALYNRKVPVFNPFDPISVIQNKPIANIAPKQIVDTGTNIFRDTLRQGAEAALTYQGGPAENTSQYYTQIGGLKIPHTFIYGSEPLRSFNDPNRPSQKFAAKLPISKDQQKGVGFAIPALLLGSNFLGGEGAVGKQGGKIVAEDVGKQALKETPKLIKLKDTSNALYSLFRGAQTPEEAVQTVKAYANEVLSKGDNETFQALKQAAAKYKSDLVTGPGKPRDPMNEPIITELDKILGKTINTVKTDFKQANVVFRKAKSYQKEFQSAVDEIAQAGGTVAQHGPVKSVERVIQKAFHEKGGDLSQVHDWNRSMIPINSREDMGKFMDAIKAKFGDFTAINDNFDSAPGTYKKIIVNVNTPAGHQAEIQFTTPEMWKAKMELGGDKLYNQARVGQGDYQAITMKMKKLYADADAAASARLKSSADTALPSPSALTGGNGAPEAVIPNTSPVLESTSTLTNVPSTSKNFGSSINNAPLTGSVAEGQPVVNAAPERGFISTVKNAETTAPEVASKVEGTYNPVHNSDQISEAAYYVKNDYEGAKARVQSEPLSAETNALGQEIMRQSQAAGRYQEAIDMAQTLAQKGTEAGQGVQAFANWARLTPEGMLKFATQEVLNANQKMGVLTKVLRQSLGKSAAVLNAEDTKFITQTMEKAAKTTDETLKASYIKQVMERIGSKIPWGVSDVLDEYRYNNMLSNPLTHLRNIWSNLLQAYAVRPATLATQGKLSEAAKYEVAAFKALPDALGAFKTAFKEGTPLGRLDEPGKLRPVMPSKVGFLNIPSRALEGADQFFKTIIQSGELAAGATKEQAGLSAEKYLFRGGLNTAEQGHLLNGIDRVTKATYALRKVGLGWFIPFVRTPMNVAKAWIEYSPAGLATLPGAANQKEQLAKAALGSIATLVGAELALNGRTTWAAPSDPKAKQYFYDSGRKPYSVLIDGKWIPMQTFGVFAWALGLPAAYKYYNDESPKAQTDGQIEKLIATGNSILGFWSNQTFVNNLGSFVQLAQGNQDFSWTKNLTYTASQLKPWDGLMRYVATVIDPIYRKPDTSSIAQNAISDVPFLTKTLPAYTDSLGNTSKRNITNYTIPYAAGQANPTFEEPYQNRLKILQQNAVINDMKKQAKNADNSAIDKASAAGPNDNIDVSKSAFQDEVVKQRLQINKSGIAKLSDGSYAYIGPKGKINTLNLNPPTKGTGIGSFANTDWQASKAADVWNNQDLPDQLKTLALKQLGVSADDARYAGLTKYNADISTQYILSKVGDDHQKLLDAIQSGRVVGITGDVFAKNGVIDNLYDKGLLSSAERAYYKKLYLNKDGSLTDASKKALGKGKKLSIKKPDKISVKNAKTAKVKSSNPVKFSKIAVKKSKSSGKKLSVKKPAINPRLILQKAA